MGSDGTGVFGDGDCFLSDEGGQCVGQLDGFWGGRLFYRMKVVSRPVSTGWMVLGDEDCFRRMRIVSWTVCAKWFMSRDLPTPLLL